MQNQIIYSAQTKSKSKTFISRMCKCLDFLKKNKNNKNCNPYHPEIDTPKSSFLGLRKIIVLDLDETLVHSQFQPMEGCDFQIDIVVQAQNFRVYVCVRPGATNFIEKLNEYYDVILWTASLQEYADPVMDYIDPQKKAIGRVFRSGCSVIQMGLTKDLTKLGRDLKDVLIVDNSLLSFCLNPENGFKIKDFYYDKSDNELEQLLPFFIWLSQLPDVRPVAEQYQQYMNSPSELLNQRKSKSIVPLEQEKCISRSLTFEKEKEKVQKGSLIRTLTLSMEAEEDFEQFVIRQRAGLNSPIGEMKVENPTGDSEKETFEMGN